MLFYRLKLCGCFICHNFTITYVTLNDTFELPVINLSKGSLKGNEKQYSSIFNVWSKISSIDTISGHPVLDSSRQFFSRIIVVKSIKHWSTFLGPLSNVSTFISRVIACSNSFRVAIIIASTIVAIIRHVRESCTRPKWTYTYICVYVHTHTKVRSGQHCLRSRIAARSVIWQRERKEKTYLLARPLARVSHYAPHDYNHRRLCCYNYNYNVAIFNRSMVIDFIIFLPALMIWVKPKSWPNLMQ